MRVFIPVVLFLALAQPVRCEPTLSQRLLSADEATREAASRELEGLSKASRQGIMPAMIHALKNPEPDIRDRAAVTLGRMGPEAARAGKGLALALKDGDARVVCSAARSLRKVDASGHFVVTALIETIHGGGDAGRKCLARELGNTGSSSKETVTTFIQLLEERDGAIRTEAARALGQIGPAAEKSVPALIRLLKERSGLQEEAASALANIGTSEADEAVAEYRKSEER